MGKWLPIVVAFVLLGTARLWAGGGLSLPFLSASAAPPVPASVQAIGTPAPVSLPEADPTKWFPADVPADPLDPARWREIAAFVAALRTESGWTEGCKKVGTVAGAERTANPALAALACSSDPSVTRLQRLAVEVLAARAAFALWLKGAPYGVLPGAVGAQAEVRTRCIAEIYPRDGAGTPLRQVCDLALDTAYATGDGLATFNALGEAYGLLAAEIGRLDATVDAEPAFADGSAATPAAGR